MNAQSLTIRLKTPDDDQFLVELRNRLDDPLPPTSVASFRHWERVDMIPKDALVERYVAEEDGRPVGQIFLEKMRASAQPGGFYGGVRVAPEAWGRGIGRLLSDHLESRVQALDGNRLYGFVRRDRLREQAFAKARGYEHTGHGNRWSRLDPKRANLEGHTGSIERLEGEGISIKTLADTGESEEFLRKLHVAQDEAVADIPMSEKYMGSPFEQFLEELREPTIKPERIWIAMDGDEPVGIASLPVEESGAAFNGFTGTRRAYRGRGIARALKLKTVHYAQDHDIPFIYTANDVNNKRMLAINDSLGYEVLPINEEVVKRFGEPA